MRILVQLISYLWFLKFLQISCQNETEIQKTFLLLAKGAKTIELTNDTNVVIVLGVTGSGKSTTIQWLAGDNTKLISKETFPGSGDYIIEDTNDKIGSSSVSKTLYPELVVDAATGTTLYDFPGFSDTRSPSYDIAASFFMKTVMDHVKNVKLLFVTNYFSVQKGMDRIGFRGLLKNIHSLISDLDKFKISIALVVSKVDNTCIKVNKTSVPKPDSVIIQGIANFLNQLTDDFERDLKRSDISDKQRKFSTNAIKIISIFLTKENGEYTCIKLFRKPDEAGPLSEIKLLTEGKVALQKIMTEKLRYASTKPNEFGFTISDNSKLGINRLAALIDDQINASIDEIATDIQQRMQSFVEPVCGKIEASNLEALSLTESQAFNTQVDQSILVLSDAVNYFTNLKNITGMGKMVKIYLTQLNVEVPPSMEENMEKFSKYFDFFQIFTEDALPISSLSWAKSFQTPLTYLSESKEYVSDKAGSLAERINSEVKSDKGLGFAARKKLTSLSALARPRN